MAQQRTVTGFVKRLFEKNGQSSKGPWTAYSIKIVNEEGEEDPRWYQFGFDKPPFKTDHDTDGHGDYVQFDVTDKDEKASQFVPGTGKVLKNAPARKAAQKSSGGGGRGGYRGGGGAKVTNSDLFGQIGGYNTEDDVRRISMSHAQEMAVKTVELLLEADGLSITKATSKANQAKRYEEIVAAIDKLTVKFFYDTATGRLLETVEDEGSANVKADALPEDHDQPAEPDTVPQDEESDEVPPDPDEDGDEEVTF